MEVGAASSQVLMHSFDYLRPLEAAAGFLGEAAHIEPRPFLDGHGLFAKKHLSAGEELFRIPLDALMTREAVAKALPCCQVNRMTQIEALELGMGYETIKIGKCSSDEKTDGESEFACSVHREISRLPSAVTAVRRRSMFVPPGSYAMCPVVDMINHGAENCRLVRLRGHVAVVTTSEVEGQLFFDYGIGEDALRECHGIQAPA